MKPGAFFSELKRRNVYKVAVAYAVIGWLLIQVATQVFPFLEIPNWAIRLVIMLFALGFPVALILAWAFELTPEGVKRTEVANSGSQHSRSRTWIYVVAVSAAVSGSLFVLGRYTAQHGISGGVGEGDRRPAAQVAEQSVSEKSLAVLPFVNLSGNPENAYFAAGNPRMNSPWTALGTPAISIPMPVLTGLPLGLQLTAEHGQDTRVIHTAMRVQGILATEQKQSAARPTDEAS